MFREMRRKGQLLSQEESRAILSRGTSGVLAVLGDEGYPYAVPLSYVYQDAKILFHCAVAGHKLDALRAEPKASFCVIDQDEVLPEKFTTCFRSVIAFGRVRELTGREEKLAAIRLLSERYAPGHPGREEEIGGSLDRLCMLELAVEHMTGKEAIELVRRRDRG